MRLQQKIIQKIKNIVTQIMGEHARVSLFGSRLDKDKKGGDIDLLITADPEQYTLQNKIKLLVALKRQIGDRKIDIVFDEEKESIFLRQVKQQAVRL